MLTKGIFLKLFLFIREYARKEISQLFNFGPCNFLPSSVKTKSKLCLVTFPCISFQLHRESLGEGTISVLHCLLPQTNLLWLYQIQHLALFLLLLIVPVVSFPGYYGPFLSPGRFLKILSQKSGVAEFSKSDLKWVLWYCLDTGHCKFLVINML